MDDGRQTISVVTPSQTLKLSFELLQALLSGKLISSLEVIP